MSQRNYRSTAFQPAFEWLLCKPLAAIALIVIITLFFSWHIPSFSIRTSIHDLIIEDLPETTNYKAFKNIFGSDEIIRVVIKTGNVFDPITFRKIEDLSKAVSSVEGVKRVISLPEIKKAVDASSKEWSIAEFSTMLAPVKLF